MKILIIFLATLLAGCSGTDVAGGTGTETTNGMVILTSTGAPAENGVAYHIDPTQWIQSISKGVSPVKDSSTIGSNGIISHNSNDEIIEIRWGDESAVVTEERDTVILSKGNTLRGTAPGASNIYVAGTSFNAKIENDSFSINGVPHGTYAIWINSSELSQSRERVNVSVDQSPVTVTGSSSLLFEDFRGGFDNNPLTGVIKGVQWYLVSDGSSGVYKKGEWIWSENSQGGSSRVSTELTDETVRTDVFLGSSFSFPFAGIGVSLFGETYQTGFDLTAMDTISLRLRGEGTLELALESELLDQQDLSHYRSEIPLQSSWATVKIPVESLHLLPKDSGKENSFPWSNCAVNIKRLEFLWRSQNNETDQNYWIEIDEIRFNNVTLPF